MDDYDFNSIENKSEFDQVQEEKQGKSTTTIILIVVGIVIGVMVIGTIVMAGVVFLWAQSFTDEADGGIETVNVKGSIDAQSDEVTIEAISGTYFWDDYRVSVDGVTFSTTATSTSAGGEAVFTTTGWDAETGSEYNIKIINIGNNAVVWENDVIAKAS